MNEKVVGHFLAYKRSLLTPATYGLPTTHRRVTGLRRDEVADLAHISSDWYTRLEQGRPGVKPSVDVLQTLSQVLQLTLTEEQYLFNLIGAKLPVDHQQTIQVPESLVQLMQQQLPNPAVILDQHLTIINWNTSYAALYGDLTGRGALTRNLIWQTFKSPLLQTLMPDWGTYAQQRTAQFRQLYSTMPTDDTLYQVFMAIRDLDQFQQPWQNLKTQALTPLPLLLNHPQVGALYLTELPLKTSSDHYLLVQLANDQATATKLNLLNGVD
ncbi:helix-turn-helix domain-containing protein [Lactiplantibacillus mudanjiangensis]|uniref:Transcriptional regulator, XRE family [Lactobacillus casei BL23] n=1 Tax=Lactiplantibacillus mudanjiangensis TaxID=1296538 RepID=A0A660DXR5_9LACO|nr:helix-turn-helix transcriptional regulator [Lactiplantibacillus mudanjiangensis]VDG19423.1 Transcriptional regulator, XRE family [Lactobacillus casei BL23] [Lactiplantibacillus mudanjiangensis]VDG25008.1 Transcriptional regulator, XRE family [Lactobacillus casei BL23] [Lactiplantibacillus mudanjiangensis]VDG27998.1 Transcriptional regulator, XRE family [Lactobacillus casei BL23] [Lactiplantibacillus mudanjiangensis]VDG30877.1 Transcriptional regulator, XRE family [Lactobacillus casei BL23] [